MTAPDLRTPEQVAEDKALRGTWWRCLDHGLTQNPIYMDSNAGESGAWYCPDDLCMREVLVVHATAQDPKATPSVWRKSTEENRLPPTPEPRVETVIHAPKKEAPLPTPKTSTAAKKARPMREIILELLGSADEVEQAEVIRTVQEEHPAVRAGPVVVSLRRLVKKGEVVQRGRWWALTSAEDESVEPAVAAGDGMVSGEIPGQGGDPHETPAPATTESATAECGDSHPSISAPEESDAPTSSPPPQDRGDAPPEAPSDLDEELGTLGHVTIEATSFEAGRSFFISGSPEHIAEPLEELLLLLASPPPAEYCGARLATALAAAAFILGAVALFIA